MMREAAPWSPKMISSGSRLICITVTSSLPQTTRKKVLRFLNLVISANASCGKVSKGLHPTRTFKQLGFFARMS